MKKIITSIIVALVTINSAIASDDSRPNKQMIWPFEGMFGTFDRQAAQRGAKVYLEVCSACHGLSRLYYRNLKNIGFSDAEIKAIASNYEVIDGPDAYGEMFTRSALASDHFVSPYPNEEAARASNNGAFPVDLSLIIKARPDGANYLYSLLTGYEDPPEGHNISAGLYYNPYFPGEKIAMPQPFVSDQVEYTDGTSATVEQLAKDVTIFLQYASEPEMEHRKSMGLKVMIYLTIFTIFFYIVKRKIWKNIK